MQISVDAVTKAYGSVRALENASLAIEPGQIVSVLGPNGAGKTTLLLCLAGIVAPHARVPEAKPGIKRDLCRRNTVRLISPPSEGGDKPRRINNKDVLGESRPETH